MQHTKSIIYSYKLNHTGTKLTVEYEETNVNTFGCFHENLTYNCKFIVKSYYCNCKFIGNLIQLSLDVFKSNL